MAPSSDKEYKLFSATRTKLGMVLALGVIAIFSYKFCRTTVEVILMSGYDVKKHNLMLNSTLKQYHCGINGQNSHGIEAENKKQEIERLLAKLEQLVPRVSFKNIWATTSAKNSKVTILNHRSSYCIGDPLLVQVDAYSHLGKRKKYGGDFLQARIYSSSLWAGASGRITDYRNGTYLVNFTLFWAGDVRVSLLLIHPSEGVSALWAARKKGYDKIAFTGKFANGISTKCGFVIETNAELCEYLDERDQEAFYCVKPKNVPCEAFVLLKSNNTFISYFTASERSFFHRFRPGVPIPQTVEDIQVSFCKNTNAVSKKECNLTVSSQFPSGFVLQDKWYPASCTTPTFWTLDQIDSCLERKTIFLLGDSTIRQWLNYFMHNLSNLTFLDTHGTDKHRNLMALDMNRSIQIQWKKHGHPLVSYFEYKTTDHSYVAREIDSVPGDRDTAVVISLGQHFRPFPIELFLQRMLNIRGAIQRLLLRSPDTKVIIKAENIREMDIDQERFSDFHGYTQYIATKDIFQGLNVCFIDAWDMTIAYATSDVHPPDNVVGNQINMFLNYIC